MSDVSAACVTRLCQQTAAVFPDSDTLIAVSADSLDRPGNIHSVCQPLARGQGGTAARLSGQARTGQGLGGKQCAVRTSLRFVGNVHLGPVKLLNVPVLYISS